jgi:hypothetical protein
LWPHCSQKQAAGTFGRWSLALLTCARTPRWRYRLAGSRWSGLENQSASASCLFHVRVVTCILSQSWAFSVSATFKSIPISHRLKPGSTHTLHPPQKHCRKVTIAIPTKHDLSAPTFANHSPKKNHDTHSQRSKPSRRATPTVGSLVRRHGTTEPSRSPQTIPSALSHPSPASCLWHRMSPTTRVRCGSMWDLLP